MFGPALRDSSAGRTYKRGRRGRRLYPVHLAGHLPPLAARDRLAIRSLFRWPFRPLELGSVAGFGARARAGPVACDLPGGAVTVAVLAGAALRAGGSVLEKSRHARERRRPARPSWRARSSAGRRCGRFWVSCPRPAVRWAAQSPGFPRGQEGRRRTLGRLPSLASQPSRALWYGARTA